MSSRGQYIGVDDTFEDVHLLLVNREYNSKCIAMKPKHLLPHFTNYTFYRFIFKQFRIFNLLEWVESRVLDCRFCNHVQ